MKWHCSCCYSCCPLLMLQSPREETRKNKTCPSLYLSILNVSNPGQCPLCRVSVVLCTTSSSVLLGKSSYRDLCLRMLGWILRPLNRTPVTFPALSAAVLPSRLSLGDHIDTMISLCTAVSVSSRAGFGLFFFLRGRPLPRRGRIPLDRLAAERKPACPFWLCALNRSLAR